MKRDFITSRFYHIFNEGVDNRKIFCDQNDRIRFIRNLYDFNNTNPVVEFSRRDKKKEESKKVGSRTFDRINIRFKKANNTLDLLNLYAFLLMQDHYHLLVEQLKDNGITLFMRKINTGYTKSFNKKYNRHGHLFQGSFKSTDIDDNICFGFLICYIHSKPLSLWRSGWESKRLTNLDINEALKFLEKYQWSSHLEYIGKRKFSSIISKEFLLDFFDGTKGYKEFFINWLKHYKKNIKYINKLVY